VNQIKERIETLLKDQFLTIKDLETKAGLKEKTLWYFLRGKTQVPKIDTLVAVSKALSCPLEELVFGKKEEVLLNSAQAKDLFQSVFSTVISYIKNEAILASTDDVYKTVMELYAYCIEAGHSVVDEKFAGYLLKKNFPATK